MKICVFGTRGFPGIEGGVEKHCQMLYPQMDQETEIVVFRRKSYVREHGEYRNIRFVDLPSTRIKGVEAVIHSFLSCIHTIKRKPDVAHIHNIGPALFAPLLKLFSIPVVLTYHSPNYEHKKWGFFGKTLLKFCEFVALRSADKILFVNRFQMEKYPEKIRAKSLYVPNGISECVHTEETDCIEKFGLQRNKYILSVGRITPEKGFHTLIEAFAGSNLVDYKLVIAGGVEFEHAYGKELKQLAADAPVVFTGYVFGKTLEQLYSHAALFVLASENEGFPLVLLEAMGYKRDVLVSDIPATHLVELREEDYFPVGDVPALREKLTKKLGEAAEREYDLSAFTWENNAKQVAQVYRSLCKQGERV